MHDPEPAPDMTSAQIIDRLRDTAAAEFESLAGAIASGYTGDVDTTVLCLPWPELTRHVAGVLALSGKSLDDLANAVNSKRGGR